MKLTCSQAALNSNLQCVSRAVAARPTHPVLANVLLTADEGTGKVSLIGFDLSLGIRTTFTASVEQSGAITLPSRLLGDIVSRLSADSPLSLQSANTPDSDSSDRNENDQGGSLSFQLKARTGDYTIMGMPAEDFPDLPMAQSPVAVPLPVESLRNGLSRTLFATSSDEAKQILTGVHLVVSPSGLEFAATDGHRLAVLSQPNDNSSLQDEGFQVTIPARSLRELEQLLSSRSDEPTIDLYHDQGQVVFLRADQVVTSRTLDGVYPKYDQLIPETFSRSFTVDRLLMITALERVAVLADQQNSVVKISIDVAERQLRICAEVQDVGRGDESVPLSDGEGSSMDVAFNVRYLLDGLKALPTPDVKFRMNNPTNPVVLQPQGGDVAFTYLVMPVQIRN